VLQVRLEFKNKDSHWYLNIKVAFNGHADDNKAVRKAVMNELEERYPKAKGFVRGITVIERKMK